MCRKCFCFIGSIEVDKEVTIVDDVIQKMTKFSYLGDILSSGRGMQEAVSARTTLVG